MKRRNRVSLLMSPEAEAILRKTALSLGLVNVRGGKFSGLGSLSQLLEVMAKAIQEGRLEPWLFAQSKLMEETDE